MDELDKKLSEKAKACRAEAHRLKQHLAALPGIEVCVMTHNGPAQTSVDLLERIALFEQRADSLEWLARKLSKET